MNAALLAYWTHDLDPVAFRFPVSWGLRGVHWYGLAYAAGFLVAAWLLGRWRRAGLTPLRSPGRDWTAIPPPARPCLPSRTVCTSGADCMCRAQSAGM